MKKPKSFTFAPLYIATTLFLVGYFGFHYVTFTLDRYIQDRLYQEQIVEIRLLSGDKVELVHVNGRIDRYQGTPFNRREVFQPRRSGVCYSRSEDCTGN